MGVAKLLPLSGAQKRCAKTPNYRKIWVILYGGVSCFLPILSLVKGDWYYSVDNFSLTSIGGKKERYGISGAASLKTQDSAEAQSGSSFSAAQCRLGIAEDQAE